MIFGTDLKVISLKYFIKILPLSLLFSLFACGGSSIEFQKALEEESSVKPDQLAYLIKVHFFEDDWTKAILTADRAEIYFNTNQTKLIGNVVVQYFSKFSGKRLSILSADNASIDDGTKDMIAWGNVVVFSDSANVKLETSKLHWSNDKQIVFTNEPIKVTSPSEIINGVGFESDLNFSYYKIFKVSGIKYEKISDSR